MFSVERAKNFQERTLSATAIQLFGKENNRYFLKIHNGEAIITKP